MGNFARAAAVLAAYTSRGCCSGATLSLSLPSPLNGEALDDDRHAPLIAAVLAVGTACRVVGLSIIGAIGVGGSATEEGISANVFAIEPSVA